MFNNNIALEDDIQPSEEITQGAYDEQDDSLSSDQDEEFLNPFKDEPEIKPAVSSIRANASLSGTCINGIRYW